MHRDAADIVVHQLNLPGMQAYAHLQARRSARIDDRLPATDRARRAVERGEAPVAERLDLAPAELRQLTAHRRLMRRQQLAPASVAKFRGSLCRADDVREHHRRQHAVGLRHRAGTGEELLHLAEHRVCIARPGEMVDPRNLDVPGARDLRRELRACAPIHDPVGAPVDHEGRNVDRGEDGPDVDVEEHLEDLLDHPRTRRRALHPGGELDGLRIIREAGSEQRHRALRVASPIWSDELGRRLAQRLGRRGPRVVRRLRRATHRAVEHQGARPIGVGRREQDAHRPALGDPEERRPLGARSVHDRSHVVRPLLERLHPRDRVGQPGAALVEEDQARERAEPVEEANDRGHLPLELEVGGEAKHEHQVDRPVADHLIGDRAVTGLGVVRWGSAHRET